MRRLTLLILVTLVTAHPRLTHLRRQGARIPRYAYWYD